MVCTHPMCPYWNGDRFLITGRGCTFDWEKYRSDRKKKIYNPHPCEDHNKLAEAIAERRGWVASKADGGNYPSSVRYML